MKIFQIGFNRCGTGTLHQFFEANGVLSVHWDNGRLASAMLRNLLEGRPLLRGYERFGSFADMEFLSQRVLIDAYKFFPLLQRAHCDAVFILNTRSQERWIESRLNHANGDYAKLYKNFLGVASDAELIDAWRLDWNRHHQRVRRYFSERGRLIEFNIEADGPEKLAKAIPELNLDPGRYDHVRNIAAGLKYATS